MLKIQDESSQTSVKLTPEDFSREVLGVGKKKKYLRGFGVGPKPSQASLVSEARSEEMENLRANLEEQNREREEQRKFEEQEKKIEEQQLKFTEQEKKIKEQQMKFEEQQLQFAKQQRQFQEQQKQMACLQNMLGLLLQDREGGHNI